MKRLVMILSLLLCFMVSGAGAATATFDDLTLGTDSYWNGSDESGGFISGDAYFSNNYNTDWKSWDGWAYSNMTDTITAGYTNQYSAYTGGGVNSSSNYSIFYQGFGSNSTIISFGAQTGEDYNTIISGAYFTNTTYAYLSMKDGDQFVNAFDSGDWQTLTIKGITENGYTANSVDFILADYRDGNSYIVDEWTWVDLRSLGQVIGLDFSLSGSQENYVPKYFAMDNLNAVPVPGAIWLLASGIIGLAGLLRRRS